MRKQIYSQRGISFIELLVAMIISAIVALTAGTILYYVVSNWKVNKSAVELQQDGTIAMYTMERNIRPATSAQVDASAPTQLIIGTKSFYKSDNSLIYDPNIGMSGDEVIIIDGLVLALSFEEQADKVIINLTLQRGSDTTTTTTMASTINLRNND